MQQQAAARLVAGGNPLQSAETSSNAFFAANPLSSAQATGTVQQKWAQFLLNGQTIWEDVSGKGRAPITEQLAEAEASNPKGEGPYYQSKGGGFFTPLIRAVSNIAKGVVGGAANEAQTAAGAYLSARGRAFPGRSDADGYPVFDTDLSNTYGWTRSQPGWWRHRQLHDRPRAVTQSAARLSGGITLINSGYPYDGFEEMYAGTSVTPEWYGFGHKHQVLDHTPVRHLILVDGQHHSEISVNDPDHPLDGLVADRLRGQPAERPHLPVSTILTINPTVRPGARPGMESGQFQHPNTTPALLARHLPKRTQP